MIIYDMVIIKKIYILYIYIHIFIHIHIQYTTCIYICIHTYLDVPEGLVF